MKPLNLILTLSLFFTTTNLEAQENERLIGNWYLNDHTRLQFEDLYTLWEVSGLQASSYYYSTEAEWHVTFTEKELKIRMVQLPNNYYDEEGSSDTTIVDSARFELFYLNDSSFAIHPLDVGAVHFLDQIQQQGYVVEGAVERDRKFYEQYVKELGKAKGKKREEVINRWKKTHKLYVDTAVFFREEWYADDWYEDHEEPFIDSIFYSIKQIESDSIHYHDFKLYPSGEYSFRNHTVARTPNDGEMTAEELDRLMPATLPFIPPVIVNEEYYDAEQRDIESDEVEPEMEEEHYIPLADVAYLAGEGYYNGEVSIDMIYALDEEFLSYGPSKPHDHGVVDGVSCYYQCEKVKLRVYYRETYIDLWLDYYRLPISLEPFMEAFGSRWENIETFDQITGPVSFPISFSKD